MINVFDEERGIEVCLDASASEPNKVVATILARTEEDIEFAVAEMTIQYGIVEFHRPFYKCADGLWATFGRIG